MTSFYQIVRNQFTKLLETFVCCSWILWPPPAESERAGHKRSQSQHKGQWLPAAEISDFLQGQVSATYVPSHLHHILFEIFKNSMRATCEFSEKKGISELPVWVILYSFKDCFIICFIFFQDKMQNI